RYGNLSRGLGEGELVSADGEIAIPWPVRRDGRAIELDILLVTATNPSIAGGQYPSPGAIAGAWKTSGGRSHVSYFWNNRKHGIETFQDGEIEALLVSQEP